MSIDRLSRPATGTRTPKLLLLGAVLVSLVGCSADAPSGTDSVLAIEEAQAEAAAEVAEVQAAIDRQVAAADAQKDEAQATADEAAQQAADRAAAEKVAADRAAAVKVAADRAAAEKAAADRAAAAKVAADRASAAKTAVGRAAPRKAAPVAKAGAGPVQRTPPGGQKAAGDKKVTPQATGGRKVPIPPVPRPQPAAARPPAAATMAKPALPVPRPAATKPPGPPQRAVSSPTDLHIVVAPTGTISVPGNASVAAGCLPQDFHPGDRVHLATASGATVHETVLPACQREVLSAPGTGVSTSSPRFSVTLPGIAWRDGDAWLLQIGTHRWPVTAATLSAYGWSIAVTAQAGITAGPSRPALAAP